MRILPITFLELKLKTNIFQFKKLLKSRKKVSMVKSKISQSKVDSILKINASFQDQSGSKWARGGGAGLKEFYGTKLYWYERGGGRHRIQREI